MIELKKKKKTEGKKFTQGQMVYRVVEPDLNFILSDSKARTLFSNVFFLKISVYVINGVGLCLIKD